MSETLHILLQKLDRFIRRYYLNRLIKGALLFGAGFLVLFILFVSIEYFGYLDSTIRRLLFYSFVLFNGYVFIRYVLIPFFGTIRIGKRISPDQAARLLSKFYPDDLKDQVTNVLQLKQYLDRNPGNAALIMAAIDQKAESANVVPFHKAIPLKGNLRFLPYVILPLLVVLGLYLVQPTFLFEPTRRLVRYDMHFERPTPFVVDVVSSTEGFRHEDLEVVIRTSGEVVPSEAFLRMDGVRHPMSNPSSATYAYTIRNLQEDMMFYIDAEGFTFGPFPINVYEKPAFTHFHIEVDYPSYSGLEAEDFTNMGDLSVLYGSEIKWTFFTRATDQVDFFLEDQALEDQALDVDKVREGEFTATMRATESFDYSVFTGSEDRGKGDSLSYRVQVEEDAYPRIAVEEHRDDVMIAHLFYRGSIRDDFGFTGLRLFYRVMDQTQVNEGDDVPFMDEAVEIDPYMRNQTFYYHFDMESVYVQPGETVELYFEVYDNDPLRGPKSARSRVFSHYIPSEEEMVAEQRESEERIQDGLREGRGEAGDARDQVEELRRQLLDSESVGWEQREMLQELLDKQQQMEERIRELAEEKKEQETRSEQFMESDDQLKEKQEELQRLFDEVMSDEMRDLFEQLQQEMDQLNRDDIYEMLDQMDFEFQDMERSMDRALEMFRQFAMERMLDESIDRLEELQEAQEELREQTLGGDDQEGLGQQQEGLDQQQEGLDQQQEELNQAYDQVRDMLEDFRETNESLSRPHTLDDTSQDEEDVSESLQEALDNLMDGSPGEAGQNQQDAGEQMNQLSDVLQGMQQRIFQEQLAEDARAIRMLLENLLKSSFAQEDLIHETRQANMNDPRFVAMIRNQRKIQSDMEVIEDSLVALAQRQMAIRSYVNREVAEVQRQMRESIDHMINRRQNQAASRQQYSMTHINNLALMLNESLQEVQDQMAMGQGMGDDSDDGPGEPSFQNMREMQEQMNEMLQEMQDGHQPMPGETGEEMSLSEQMARMAAQQEAIRNELRRKEQEMRNQGQEVDEGLQELQRQMEESELDMLRKELSSQTMERQQDILTRLLEHERAERQQEEEDRREGTTAIDYELSNPEEIFQYNRDREREVEMLRSLPPRLRPFFRQKVEMYFLHVD